MTYPTYGGSPAQVFANQYDNVGRLNGVTEDQGNGQGPQNIATGTLGPAGQLTGLSYFVYSSNIGINESLSYNNPLQLTTVRSSAIPLALGPMAQPSRLRAGVEANCHSRKKILASQPRLTRFRPKGSSIYLETASPATAWPFC
jgi:hypothetical protein